ncbi:hypothetical protein BKA69DRAFT_1171990 [Paraphysoderma sedebokerense]|nr:hypothetical protein BKA69DRAFT_1171990 [Paraphysoderma sedebokerense]
MNPSSDNTSAGNNIQIQPQQQQQQSQQNALAFQYQQHLQNARLPQNQQFAVRAQSSLYQHPNAAGRPMMQNYQNITALSPNNIAAIQAQYFQQANQAFGGNTATGVPQQYQQNNPNIMAKLQTGLQNTSASQSPTLTLQQQAQLSQIQALQQLQTQLRPQQSQFQSSQQSLSRQIPQRPPNYPSASTSKPIYPQQSIPNQTQQARPPQTLPTTRPQQLSPIQTQKPVPPTNPPSSNSSVQTPSTPQQQLTYDSLPDSFKTVVPYHVLQTYFIRDKNFKNSSSKQYARQIGILERARSEHQTWENHYINTARLTGCRLGTGFNGYGNGQTGIKYNIIMPKDRRRAGNRQVCTGQWFFPEERVDEIAQKEESLVPIRIDLEIEGIKFRDTFTWNMNESLIKPDQFAVLLCEDMELPIHLFSTPISKAIQEQIDDYKMYGMQKGDRDWVAGRGIGGLLKEREAWNSNTADTHQSNIVENVSDDQNGPAQSTDGDDLRIIVQLDISIGSTTLVDHFEWDINCRRNEPELFAESMVRELNLPSEFTTAISHSIREQIHQHYKSLLMIGYPFDGSPIANIDDEVASGFLVPVDRTNVVRDGEYLEYFGPDLVQMTEDEREKLEKERERDTRRKRRSHRRGKANVMPDREPLKTNRTELVSDPVRLMTVSRHSSYVDQFIGVNGTISVETEKIKDAGVEGKSKSTSRKGERRRLDSLPRQLQSWKCKNCQCTYDATPLIRYGPNGEKTLCNACGIYYQRFGRLRTIDGVPGSGAQEQTESQYPDTLLPPSQPSSAFASNSLSGSIPSSFPIQSASTGRSASVSTPPKQQPLPIPEWLVICRAEVSEKYPHDRFDFVKSREGIVRIKCLDCDLTRYYSIGPGETLDNFEKHLKNRGHRANVEERVKREGGGSEDEEQDEEDDDEEEEEEEEEAQNGDVQMEDGEASGKDSQDEDVDVKPGIGQNIGKKRRLGSDEEDEYAESEVETDGDGERLRRTRSQSQLESEGDDVEFSKRRKLDSSNRSEDLDGNKNPNGSSPLTLDQNHNPKSVQSRPLPPTMSSNFPGSTAPSAMRSHYSNPPISNTSHHTNPSMHYRHTQSKDFSSNGYNSNDHGNNINEAVHQAETDDSEEEGEIR